MLVEFELIQKAQKGDDAAFNQVVVAYRKRILGTIARLIGRPEDVEDVAQEVFLRLYYSLDQLRTPEVFEPWLYRLTVNASYDYLRKQRRRNEARMSDLTEQQVMMADAAGRREGFRRARASKAGEGVGGFAAAVGFRNRIEFF
jgi:RNA polymerase sigma-70 factor (ECF subfamily)